ncbi:hypothetical protein H072_1314 [Dactylellina haptotyla CBS 200.50]|uniref:Phosphoglycerate mutase n=1 Tax=Dactylellina haptotyla (strain CBS 200.50) TaxID=1284197 RepID=S8BYW9_DACHA|nr:hypothetical protein H072_1314 [Dactylellina haptotyla CBS 200.50]
MSPSSTPSVPNNDASTSKKDRPVMHYMVSGRAPMFDYSVVRSLFVQSLPEYLIDQQEFNDHYFSKNFGLMLFNDNDEPDWQAFVDRVNELNANAAPDETYKVFYLARHGQGPHNEAIETYGHPLWDEKIGMLKEYKGLILGPDPDLTEKGKKEAIAVGNIWKTQIENYGLFHAGALPQKFYASPFSRALRTLELTWKDIVLNLPDAPTVRVKETLRETIGHHYCDYRGNMKEVRERFPFIRTEDGMLDEDTIWTEVREDEAGGSLELRLRDALDDIIMESGETFISITAHSGCLRFLMKVVGHRPFPLETSRMVPIVVKAKLKPEFKDKKLPEQVTGLPYTFTPATAGESNKRKDFDKTSTLPENVSKKAQISGVDKD